MIDQRLRLALGTVQFGLPYGVANPQPQVSLSEVREVLNAAKSLGITTLDTAHAYGQSEEALGGCGAIMNDFSIVTKLPPGTQTEQAALKAVQTSLSRLQLNCVDTILMHTFDDYRRNPKVVEILNKFKQQGLCRRIGFSLYYPSELQLLLDQKVSFDVVQVPYSIVDRRFETYFDTLNTRDIEVHVRSVFLQGAIFISPNKLPEYLIKARDQWQEIHNLAQQYGIDIASLCLNFVLGHPGVGKVIIGIDSLEHFKKNVDHLSDYSKVDILRQYLNGVAVSKEEILLPFLWKK